MDKQWLSKINWPSSGKYVVAISGGVDSVTLLDLLVKRCVQSFAATYDLQPTTYDLIIAHFDHGMRDNSTQDCRFVQDLAESYGLKFEFEAADLGEVSENEAREARYQFLEKVQKDYQAEAIITAHHRDDQIETSLFNALRGSHWEGITGIPERENLLRPLLELPKQQLTSYAENSDLSWREDPTNQDITYSRNYIRHRLIPLIECYQSGFKDSYFQAMGSVKDQYQSITKELENYLESNAGGEGGDYLEFRRYHLLQLPYQKQLLLLRLMAKQVGGFYPDQTQLQRMRQFALAGQPQKQLAVTDKLQLEANYGKFMIHYRR